MEDETSGQDKYSTEVVLQGYNSSLTMLDSRGVNGNSNLVTENKSSLPNDNLNQENSDLDDEIPFKFHGKNIVANNKSFKPIFVQDEMSSSYLSYAMSVIVSRALPDVRDGLKPVHRRIIYAMHKGGYDWSKTFRKSSRIVGDVIGKYHPHGDQSVYDALVRLVQDFSMSVPLITGQGNFGSIDGDPPAAMRHTETSG